MKIGIILGTRPEIIKMFPVIRECEARHLDYFILHTNQHYSPLMDAIFFEELEIPKPKYNLQVGSGTTGYQLSRMIRGIEGVLEIEKPDVVLVLGDTNTVLAGALTANKMGIKVGHIEAGLRSFDRTMPEEINRIMADHISDYLFAPTVQAQKLLTSEGIGEEKVSMVGNTIVDAVYRGSALAEKRYILEHLNLKNEDHILATCHRPATTDNAEKLQKFFKILQGLAQKYSKEVIFPVHPRTKKMIETFGIEFNSNVIRLIDPVGFIDMLKLEKDAFLVVTDSGGIQEEACILQKKCAIFRENTERPETVSIGGAVFIGGLSEEDALDRVALLLMKEITWFNPFGDGKSGEEILKILEGTNP